MTVFELVLSLSTLVVALSALLISLFALAQERSITQNPVLNHKSSQPIGTIHEDTNSLARGNRGYEMEFSVFGPGTAYMPTVRIYDPADSNRTLQWIVEHAPAVLSAGSDPLAVRIQDHVKADGLYLVVSIEVPHRFRRGTREVHYRFPIPKNGSDSYGPPEVWTRDSWKKQRMNERGPDLGESTPIPSITRTSSG